ncbi:succinate-CoA ligase, beta subunit [Selenomonas sp. oral taxon 137 str. F0430]|uniref:ADP-forming succinate--CoA ligase subunit beta n=1 Tax=Selenomonas sp. oral taxon 137 TaxID=712531 RepID=UPI0001EB228D|nr:ADP-forming succinate--CoA ligase subunit beta [Selenomonas sp. oral taxon 137]EFR41641.1 succinate-CoA ligase, beta subunit [Selenomonas sp. oral taxon 137 str. F0430]
MNIHEYQSKQVLREYGVKVPNGLPAFTVDAAVDNAEKLGAPVIVVKAQIHAGGRGKAGGVKIAKTTDEVRRYARELLGKTLVTHQTGPEGKVVNRLLIEEGSKIKKEFYLSFVIDRLSASIVMMGSEEGGVEIEKVAEEHPEKIVKEYIDPVVGLMPFQATRMAYAINIPAPAVRKASTLMQRLYAAFIGKDCSQVEINPLVVTEDDDVIALDAKLNFDDSALYRHPDIAELRDDSEEDPKELEASAHGLNYVNLGGDVACMVNGAGLAMATVDMLKHCGGEPANFLDVGGDSAPEKIATAFNIMLEGGQAKGIFVNIFGGINRCDNIANGIIEAAKLISKDGKSLPVPVVVRLEGTKVTEGREILKNTPIGNVFAAASMEDGAKQIVELVAKAKA